MRIFTLIYSIVLPFYGILWRAGCLFCCCRIIRRHGKNYLVRIFKPGSGLHYKFLLTDRKTGELYLVKLSDALIEWWQHVVFQWKREVGIPLDYPSRSFTDISEAINALLRIDALRDRTLLKYVDSRNKEIWYRYCSNCRHAESIQDKIAAADLWSLLEKHGFVFVDKSFHNVVFDREKAYLIDMESIVLKNNI